MDVSVPETVDRDISAIDFSDWPKRPMGVFLGLRENQFQVVFKQSALDDIHLHGQSSPEIEVCGVLIGNGYHDAQGPYLLVEHVIRGNGARNKSTNVTFTAETWASIQTVMDRDYADKKMIGWYHTHPGFGIFLSDMDVFICDNFFNLPWQIAFVYDPKSGEEGNFIWKDNRPKREFVLIEDDVTPKSAEIPLMPRNLIIPSVEDDPKVIELLERVRRLERRQKAIAASMVFLVAFVIMWALMFQQPTPTTNIKPVTQPIMQPMSTSQPLTHNKQ
jgi:proteasome lid subunit RPN8/RPN11